MSSLVAVNVASTSRVPAAARGHQQQEHGGIGPRRVVAERAAAGVHGANQRGVELAARDRIGRQFERLPARGEAVAHDHARPTRIERAVQPVRRHVRHRPDDARRLQGRHHGVAFRLAAGTPEELLQAPAAAVPRTRGVDVGADEHADAVAIQALEVRAHRLRRTEQHQLLRQRLLEIRRREAQAFQTQLQVADAPGRAVEAEQHAERRRRVPRGAYRHLARDQASA